MAAEKDHKGGDRISFDRPHIQEIWDKALARRRDEPSGAITLARTLLESVCKQILEEGGTPYDERRDQLPELYDKTVATLEIAPTADTAQSFTNILEGCRLVVVGIGTMRNKIGDAHGKGTLGGIPAWRHADFAVNLAGTTATYLLATWHGRQPTVGDVIRERIEAGAAPEGSTHRYTLNRLLRLSIAERPASKIQAEEIVELCRERRSEKISPATVRQDFTYLRLALGHLARDAFEKAAKTLEAEKIVGNSTRRERRPTPAEWNTLTQFFKFADRLPKAKIKMLDVMEFSASTARRSGEICQLKWVDLDEKKRTLIARGIKAPGYKKGFDHEFPLIDKAWEIVQRQPRNGPRIFPFNEKSLSAKFTKAKRDLGIVDLKFDDLRHEAVNRLFDIGFDPHEVQRVTGQKDVNPLIKLWEKRQQRPD